MKLKTMIVVGRPTKENLDRALAVAKALGFSDASHYLRHTDNREVYLRWENKTFANNGEYDPKGTNAGTIAEQDVIIDLRKFSQLPVELKLNSEYTAEIINDGQTVKVGCQEIPASKVLELAELLKK